MGTDLARMTIPRVSLVFVTMSRAYPLACSLDEPLTRTWRDICDHGSSSALGLDHVTIVCLYI
jgi:hypothetical protein